MHATMSNIKLCAAPVCFQPTHMYLCICHRHDAHDFELKPCNIPKNTLCDWPMLGDIVGVVQLGRTVAQRSILPSKVRLV